MAEEKRSRRWVFVLGTLVVLAAAGFGLSKSKLLGRHDAEETAQAAEEGPASGEAGQPRVVEIKVSPVGRHQVRRTVTAVGTFSGYDEVTVMSEVSGRVAKVYHDVGDLVRPGDLLLEIDPTDYRLALEETKRALELEATRIGLPIPPPELFNPTAILAILGGSDFDTNKLPTVVRAKQHEDLARIRLDRTKQLFDRGTVSQEEFDLRSTDYQVAVTNRTQAQMDAQAVVAGIKDRCVMLEIAEKKLRDTKVVVRPPTRREGMPEKVEYAVAQRKVTEGEMLKDAQGSSTATFELVMDGVLKLLATVPERYAGQVRVGQPAEVRVEAYPGEAFAGVVTRINPTVDRTNRTFEVEIRVNNADRRLKAGGFAKVEIITQPKVEVTTVPAVSVVSFAGSTKVFVVRDGKAHAVPMSRGQSVRDERLRDEARDRVEVVPVPGTDLRPDDQAITSGQNRLAEGVRVRLAEMSNDKGPMTKE